MSALWTAKEAARATGGSATGDWVATGVSIDSRTIRPGDLFVALSAARDGHDFVADALARGAAAAMVARRPKGVAASAPLLLVSDVQAGLEALGRAGRARGTARVIGVTGSVGKTSAKEMLAAALASEGSVQVAEASYNNHWGVPLTLARLRPETEFAVVEIGMNHPGEIAPLARLARPHAVLITTIAPAHLEAFADGMEGIAREKGSIALGLETGGSAVLPADSPHLPVLRAAAEAAGARILTFGEAAESDIRATSITLTPGATVVSVAIPGGPVRLRLTQPGRHFAQNALGVLGVVHALGADPALAALGLGQWQPPAGRGTREWVQLDRADERLGIELIDDAFNANPASMRAALEVLAAAQPVDDIGRVGRGRRIAILGDMLELGPDEARLHAALTDEPAMARVARVHCAGARMRALWQALPEAQRGRWAESAEELAREAHRLIDPGDVVLVKGSKGSRISLVVDALRKLGQTMPSSERGKG
ncbi:MAG: UDP-N-acetylmuramoyl-tripeptide--D-alanyl-D-alanine ligase [Alphaproteobacteria bacterium HGW-Alphaproteobacteria-2]|nr:MAG: UDP-N-acetylmuramoyl-tripeptide--D-alanyl-D-alanine ligase [Alphaproteobacteria bacterium HGW-Alphaproteobacteria-2]